MLSFLLARALFVSFPFNSYNKLLGTAFLIASVFGIGIEIIQEFFIITRTGQFADVAANTLGAILGLYTTKLFYG
jgi:VanZ family protein